MTTPIPPGTLAKLKDVADLKLAVQKILNGPGVSSVWVNISGKTITPKPIRAVAEAIRLGKIAVYHDPSCVLVTGNSAAFYDGGYNAMFLGFDKADTVGRKAVIVHEAVHAVSDRKKRKGMLHVDDEAAAYTAQAMYIRGLGTKAPMRLTSTKQHVDDVYKAAFKVADQFFAGKNNPSAEIEELRNAIRAHPDYAATADVTFSYDG